MFDTIPILFIITSLLIILTPGQDMVLVMSRSIAGGPLAGICTAAGVSIGLMGHTLLATFGLGAILSSSMVLFSAIKFAGGAYLVYLGYKMIKGAHSQLGITSSATISKRKLFYQGMLSNISNPKITIFYFAFLPQFLPVSQGNYTFNLFLLGTVFAILTFLIKAPIGYGAGMLSSWLKTHPKFLALVNRTNGVILICLGLRLALASRD